MTPESRPRRAAGLEKGKYKDHYQRSWVYEQQLWSHRRKLFEKERVYVTMNLLVKHSAGVPRHNHSTYITLPLSSPAKDIRSRVNSVSNRTSLHVKAEKWIFLSCFIWMKTSSCFPVIVSDHRHYTHIIAASDWACMVVKWQTSEEGEKKKKHMSKSRPTSVSISPKCFHWRGL